MHLTRRGWTVVAIVGVGEVMALAFGARALNAIVAPALVALAVGAIVTSRRETPEVTRGRLRAGFPGERRTVHLDVTADDHVFVRDELPAGVRAVGSPAASTGDDGEVSYEVVLESRGEHWLGPTRVRQRDPLGLVAREARIEAKTTVLVYPDVVSISPVRALAGLVENAETGERQAFDRLREYVHGDALRDIDWKTSAKRSDDELVVTEYTDEAAGEVTLVAAGESGHGSEMAAAAASVAVYLLNNDLPVGLVTPAGELPARRGDEHRDEILDHLARISAGHVEERPDADVRVFADRRGVEVTAGSATVDFEALRDDAGHRPITGIGDDRTTSPGDKEKGQEEGVIA